MSLTRFFVLFLVPMTIRSQASIPTAPPPLREFRIDASHSTVEFSIPFLGHSVKGRFDDVQGTIIHAPSPGGGIGASAVSVAIATSSINTGSKHRDEHLRSEDFFDAARFPVILFRSTSLTQRDSIILMAGTLSMHGVTRQVTIPFRTSGPPVDDPHGSTLVYFTGGLRIARRDFGILGGSAHNDWFDTIRSATMGDSVDITIVADGWRTDFARSRKYDGTIAKVAAEGTGFVERQVRAALAKDSSSAGGIEWELDQLAGALMQRDRQEDATTLLRLSVALSPRSAAARAALGRALEVSGARAEALRVADEALALDSANTRALELRRRVAR